MKKLLIINILLPLLFFSCSEETTSPGNSGDSRIKLLLTDSPADYDEINIVVERVEVHLADGGEGDGWFILNNKTHTYDLLELRNGVTAVLCDTFLPPGHYTQIRLIIGEGSNIVVGGVVFDLEIPSGMQTGLKLIHEFDIEPGLNYELLLDFDASKSIIVTGNGQYKLKPTIRVIALTVSGSISGSVLPPDVSTSIWTIAGSDTITTYSDNDGDFKLVGLYDGTYDVYMTPSNSSYRDTIITDVSVQAGVNTNIGTVTIFP